MLRDILLKIVRFAVPKVGGTVGTDLSRPRCLSKCVKDVIMLFEKRIGISVGTDLSRPAGISIASEDVINRSLQGIEVAR